MPRKPTRSKFSALAQICEWIPTYLVAKLARKPNMRSCPKALQGFKNSLHFDGGLIGDQVVMQRRRLAKDAFGRRDQNPVVFESP